MRLIGCPDTPRQHIGVWLDLFPLPLLFTQTAIPTVRAIMVAAQVGVFETMVGRRSQAEIAAACSVRRDARRSRLGLLTCIDFLRYSVGRYSLT